MELVADRHEGAFAGICSVTRKDVDVFTVQAVGAMIAASLLSEWDGFATVLTGESLVYFRKASEFCHVFLPRGLKHFARGADDPSGLSGDS